MALSKLSEIGGKVIIGDEQDELILPAVGDGTSKAGWMVYIAANGDAIGTDKDSTDDFTGILLPHHEVDVDTAITNGIPCSVVVPRSGHLYGVFMIDSNHTFSGGPLIFTTTVGCLGPQTDVEAETRAHTYRYTDGDTIGIVIWA